MTSKLWIQDCAYETAKATIDATLEKMGLDYLDLYLLHQPYGEVEQAWKALEEAKAAGKVKSIEVSNFTLNYWNKFVPNFKTLSAINQTEFIMTRVASQMGMDLAGMADNDQEITNLHAELTKE